MKAIFLIWLLIMIPQTYALTPFGDAMANFTNSSVITNTGPYYPDKSWSPSQEWISDQCKRDYSPYFVSGWVDIIGFERSVKINDTFFINEFPSEAAIIRYETSVCVLGRSRFKGGWDHKLETYQQSDQFVAKLTATAILYYYIEGTQYYDNITKTFYDSEYTPFQINNTRPLNVTVTFYNNSYTPKAILNAGKDKTVSERYIYKNQSIEHISEVGYVETTSKGVKYVALYPADIWKNGNESLFSTMGNAVVIHGANFSTSNLTVTAVYPFNIAINSIDYNYNEIKYNPYETFHPWFYFILLLAVIPLWILSKITWRLDL